MAQENGYQPIPGSGIRVALTARTFDGAMESPARSELDSDRQGAVTNKGKPGLPLLVAFVGIVVVAVLVGRALAAVDWDATYFAAFDEDATPTSHGMRENCIWPPSRASPHGVSLGSPLENTMTLRWPKAALWMAAAVHGGDITGVIFHIDKGGEYAGDTFAKTCLALGVVQSMGRVGSALDNAA